MICSPIVAKEQERSTEMMVRFLDCNVMFLSYLALRSMMRMYPSILVGFNDLSPTNERLSPLRSQQ